MSKYIFGTDGIRGTANEYPMTPEIALQVGKALIYSINHKKKKRILIGKDTRISGYIFETALTSGICSMGSDVLLTGPLPTPAIAHLTKSMCADAGIMISASHNLAKDNGIKFFSADGYKFNENLEKKIGDDISKKHEGVNYKNIGKAFRVETSGGRYIEYAKQTINNISLKGLKIVLDCANGAAYQVGPQVFRELGAQVIPMNINPDGLNINARSGVFFEEPVIKKVKKEKADLGVILDGDADRLVLINDKGIRVDGNEILAVAALHSKKRKNLAKDTIVTTVMANQGLHELLKKNHLKALVTPVGEKYVIDAMRKNRCNLGGESSGHIIFSDFGSSADGIVTTLKIMEIMVEEDKSLRKLLAGYKNHPQILINLPVKSKPPINNLKHTQNAIKKGLAKLGGGRILVRYSGTENIARVMVEGKKEVEVKNTAEKIAGILKKEIGDETN